jgi:hypothetical protein
MLRKNLPFSFAPLFGIKKPPCRKTGGESGNISIIVVFDNPASGSVRFWDNRQPSVRLYLAILYQQVSISGRLQSMPWRRGACFPIDLNGQVFAMQPRGQVKLAAKSKRAVNEPFLDDDCLDNVIVDPFPDRIEIALPFRFQRSNVEPFEKGSGGVVDSGPAVARLFGEKRSIYPWAQDGGHGRQSGFVGVRHQKSPAIAKKISVIITARMPERNRPQSMPVKKFPSSRSLRMVTSY